VTTAPLVTPPLRAALPFCADTADLPIFEIARLAIAVADAHPSVKSHAHFITQAHGGTGAVREVCDLILEAQRRSQP
jgi:3-deoxy-D-manno-octulosonate 8-phosphate phosphatase (KDO 8-P phosphatase)